MTAGSQGYPKRYDPAFARMREETARLTGARLLRVTTFESPLRPYIAHYPLLPRAPLPAEATAGLRADSDRRIIAALGQTTDLERQVYAGVLLDTLVHELNTVRGLLGEPTRLEYVSLALDCVTVMLRFASLPVAIHVHLKDARLAVMNEIVADQAPVTEIWTREAFCALGGGDLDVDAVLAGLRKISFGGWLVVEQDILPHGDRVVRAGRFAQAAQEQRHNRAFLAERGL